MYQTQGSHIALDAEGSCISADHALSKHDYFCPECSAVLRLRRGEKRRAHFYHLRASSCRQQHRSDLHVAVQQRIVEKIGEHQCIQELFFPQISRIADIALPKEKVVFEIQISPMSQEEVIARTKDYRSVNWHIIWILHVQTFGKRSASAFERALQTIPHYFTDLDAHSGSVWDELSSVKGQLRHWFNFPPQRHYIDTFAPVFHRELSPPNTERVAITNIQELLDIRSQYWTCSLPGDYLSRPPQNTREQEKGGNFVQKMLFTLRMLWYFLLRA